MFKNSFLKGTLQTLILRLLADRGQMYGYQIIKSLSTETRQQILVKEAALYPALHKLEARGLLESEFREVSGRQRKYYRLSEKGKKAATQEGAELAQFIAAIQQLLKRS
jgi:DNA-binding PadR family transcriptional regulator